MAKDEVTQAVHFGPYEITGAQGQVLHRQRPLALSPKAVAVLWTLVQRPGQVVSKEELFEAVWPDSVVSEGVLTSRIREVRQALRDPRAKPRYIETVSRRGYRFIEKVVSSQQGEKQKAKPRQGAKTRRGAEKCPLAKARAGNPSKESGQPERR